MPEPLTTSFGQIIRQRRESVGLSPELLARFHDETLSIPMLDPALRSLNLSTSVALATYEARRQWGWPAPIP